MNGESVFGWVKVFGVLAVLGLLAYVVLKVSQFFRSKGGVTQATLDAAQTLKDSTPLGAPSRGIDNVISFFTGRAETLGGELAEVFDPATKQVNALYNDPATSKPSGAVVPQSNVQFDPYSINPRDRN